jgi:hypothetical protein
MKPWIWLRVAAGLYAFFTLGHGYGFNFSPSRGVGEEWVFTAMRAYRFDIQGFTRTHWESHRGFGHLLTVLLVLLAALCWQLARLSREHPASARPLALSLLLASTAITALSWAYFFTAPAITASLATLSIAGAAVALRRA